MVLSPQELIRESRELEGVGVDLGTDAGSLEYQHGRLQHYAKAIKQGCATEHERAQLVDKYNTLLYRMMVDLEFRQECLPAEEKIDEDLTLLEYLRHESTIQTQGRHDLEKIIESADYVGRISTRRVSWFDDRKVSITEQERYKGLPRGNKIELLSTGWGTGLLPKSEYLVIWRESELDSRTFVSGDQMRIRGDWVESSVYADLLPFDAHTDPEERYSTIFRYEDFLDWYKNKSEPASGG